MRWVMALLLLTGCAQTFRQDGVSTRQQAADEFECAQASRVYSDSGETVSRAQMRRCMAAKGYR